MPAGVGKLAKTILAILSGAADHGGFTRREGVLRFLRDSGVSSKKALGALTSKTIREQLSDREKKTLIRLFATKAPEAQGLGRAERAQLEVLADALPTSETKQFRSRIASLFSKKESAPPAPPSAPPVVTAPAPPSGAAESVNRGRAQRLVTALRQTREAAGQTVAENVKMGEDLRTARGPRLLRAAALFGGGLAIGNLRPKEPSQQAAAQLVSEILSGRQGGIDRQGLVNAQEILTQAKTLAVLQKILAQNAGVQPAIPFS